MNTKIIEKIKKLLTLGNNDGASEGERDNVLRMAQRLMIKHNLDESVLATSEIERERSHFKVYADRWRTTTASAAAALFFCNTYRQTYRGQPAKNTLAFIGRKDNVTTAMEMAKYLTKSIDAEARKLGVGNSFKTGASAAIYWRVQDLIKKPETENSSQSTALAVISYYEQENEKNNQFLAELGVVTKPSRQKNVKQNHSEYLAGKAYGQNLSLHQQLGSCV